ncbi:hypothetical protein [Microbacterium sp. A93]|uniref:hypothetical protein n=1 Tax=Microbacterium sp. A93 TaxID=3450716 RepID=UPI003F43E464
MAFRPDHPNSSDFIKPFPEWIISAIPGAAEKDDAVKATAKAVHDATTKAAAANAKRAALGGPDGPAAHVKRAAWDNADDEYRAVSAQIAPAQLAHDRAAKARFEFVYDAMDGEAFTAQTEPLYAEASRRTQEHLDALQAALDERDRFASALGRVIDVEGGNWGLRNALANVAAYVAAGLNDEDEDAWSIVNDALGASLALTDTKMEVIRACNAIRDDKAIPAAGKADAYRAILRRFRMSPQRVIR